VVVVSFQVFADSSGGGIIEIHA